MAKNKTIPTSVTVGDFLATVQKEAKRADSLRLIAMMKEITGHEPIMWGTSIIGFGSYHYRYDSGREGDMPLTGFSPRKQNLAIYNTGFKRYPALMEKLGKYKAGGSCLYIKTLSDVHLEVLEELIKTAYAHMKAKYNVVD